MSKKKVSSSDNVYLECKKCGRIVWKAKGALGHTAKAHRISLTISDVLDHFKIVKKTPALLAKMNEQKRELQKQYRSQEYKAKLLKKNKQPKKINYKCNACDLVVGKRITLYGHCHDKHNKSFSKIGCTETTEPVTNPQYNTAKHRKQNMPMSEEEVAELKKAMPHLVAVKEAKAVDGEILMTADIKIPIAFIALKVVPHTIL